MGGRATSKGNEAKSKMKHPSETCQDGNSGGNDLWSNELPTRPRSRPQMFMAVVDMAPGEPAWQLLANILSKQPLFEVQALLAPTLVPSLCVWGWTWKNKSQVPQLTILLTHRWCYKICDIGDVLLTSAYHVILISKRGIKLS